MTFPAKVFICFVAAFALAGGFLFGTSMGGVRRAYQQLESDQVSAAFENIRRELDRGAEDVARQVGLVAESEATVRMALDLSRAQPDYSVYTNDAHGAARTHGLELFEFVSGDGTVISSAEDPGAVGRTERWVAAAAAETQGKAFLRREEIGAEIAMAQVAVRSVAVGEKKIYVAGGRRIDSRLLRALPLGAGMRALLAVNRDAGCADQDVYDPQGNAAPPGPAAAFLSQICRNPGAAGERPSFTDATTSETYFALPLGAHDASSLGAAVVVYSRAAELGVERSLQRRLLVVLAIGFVVGALVSYWGASSLSRPLARLSRAARDIVAGAPRPPDGAAALDRAGPEVAALAGTLQEASGKLAAERERLLQSERVAAWREMTRRLTGEIEVALDTLAEGRRAGDVSGAVENFHKLLDRFREFGELLVLPLQTVQLNDVVRTVLRDLEPFFNPAAIDLTRPPITPEVSLAENLPLVKGDLDVLTRAVDSLLLYAVYSMPAGGTVVVRTEAAPGFVRLHIEWPGPFPVEEEAQRLFSSGPVKRSYAAGLELATALAVITGHEGTIRTESSDVVSRIVVQLPAEGRQPMTSEPAASAETLASSAARRVAG